MRNPKSLVYYFINTMVCILYRGEYKKFITTKNGLKIQEQKLKKIIKQNAETAYGREYNFDQIETIKEYQKQVPLTDYNTYRPFIQQLEEREESLLTSEKIMAFEPTSGSTKAAKLILYTKALKEEFQKGIKPWIYNLYSRYPEIKWGKSYWSISPVVNKKQYTKSGIPIGFEEDTEYFGTIEKYLMDRIFVKPKDIEKETDIEQFYTKTALELLTTKELALISVWNPTFLILILDYIDHNKEKLLKMIKGSRQEEIKQAVYNKAYDTIWPRLKVISCWCDANAEPYAKNLTKIFPNVIIQPKGLLSTESFITFPLVGEKGGVLSIYSHFFEFIDMETREIAVVNALEIGKQYEVVVTTSGGFYRYRTYDVVEVVGSIRGLPLLIFKGKNDRISDLFGEKLHESFVREVIEKIVPDASFYMMAPEKNRYILYVKNSVLPNSKSVDKALRENFHYDYCRKLGQLKELSVFALTGNPKKEYVEGCLKRGQKLGDIKPTYLSAKEGWGQFFKGYLIDEDKNADISQSIHGGENENSTVSSSRGNA